MNKVKKALTYAVGATVVAAAGAYFAMPKEARQNLKDMISNITKKGNSSSSCTCDNSNCSENSKN